MACRRVSISGASDDMPGKIPREFIDNVLARIDLVDLIDAKVPLKRSGSNYVARCPFHVEKTPSFTVNREKQFYHCFGCGAHGDAIGFLLDYEHLDFAEAVERLAQSVGLSVPHSSENRPAGRDSVQGSDLSSLYEIQERVARFYAHQLRVHSQAVRAVDYLKSRGVSGETARDFLIGYAPPEWHILPARFQKEALQTVGLVVVKDNGDCYDRFRDRIMLPIRDRRGRVVGFGGRVVGDEMPKYLNSPETAIFTKHKEVYGLYELLKSAARPDCIIVVEGYLDVITLAQGGIRNVVATLGTAPSVEQIGLLFRYTDELIFCFDGDRAGLKAAWKALEASLPSLRDGRRLRFLTLPDGHDPDSLLREQGAEAFMSRLKAAVSGSDYFFDSLARDLDLQTIEGRATLYRRARPLIDRLPEGVFRDMMRSRLAELTQHRSVQFRGNKSRVPRTVSHQLERTPELSTLRRTLVLLLQHPDRECRLVTLARDRIRQLRKGEDEVLQKVLTFLDEHPNEGSSDILDHFQGTAEEAEVTALMTWDLPLTPSAIEAELQDAVESLRRQIKQERLGMLLDKSKRTMLDEAEREEVKSLTTKSP
jgi:DNA primase